MLHLLLVEEFGNTGYNYCFMIFSGMLVASIVLSLCVNFETHSLESDLLKRKHVLVESPNA